MAQLPAFWGGNQQEEAKKVVSIVRSLVCGSTDKIAILFRGRNKNAEVVEAELANCGLQYFYGMFTDNDLDYVEFHNKCHTMFIKKFGKSKSISKKALISFSDDVKSAYALSVDKTIGSLLLLLDALVEKVSEFYADMLSEDK